ncbi:Phytoene dehydrogenase C terminal region [Halothermothrix orenii H 168]|uniref:Phytoene dehydrogenase C terminal region n=2 Tax=Halothermothrix orenii TaxID=31909 RepID=B8D263_HALOH|nr:Phytoene dehydrogenase C terminal region [Halothermothrix orenii H 168]
MNADFAWGLQNLIPDQKRQKYNNQKLEGKKYSCSTFMLYLGLDKKYDHLLHNNVFISGDYKNNFMEIEESKVLSRDPSFYVQNASVTDPSLAPDGHSALYVLVPVPNLRSNIDWSRKTGSFRNTVIKLLEDRAGLTDIKDHIKYEKMITPLDWKEELHVGFGATFNLAHNLNQMLYFRPHNKFEEFDNMWLVGGGTNPGSGLPTIYESGRITANIMCNKYKLNYKEVNIQHNTYSLQG